MSTLRDISVLTRIFTPRLPLYLSATAASLGIFILVRSFRSSALSYEEAAIIPSPRETLFSQLSQKEIENLPYPPDALPGARDVDTPYGSIRVYEWGPEDGRKVLLIHGISTPSIALGPLAHKLVEKGCRVMMFDLFGRGYTSTPSPHTYPHSSQLFTTQIHLVLSSSLLPWTTSSFTLLGYSLGGGLAADFTSYFPRLVSHLILIAPGGLIRESHITWKSRLLYSTSGFIPERVIEWLVGRRLYSGPSSADVKGTTMESVGQDGDAPDSHIQKIGGLRTQAVYLSPALALLPGRANSTVSAVVDWQVAHHPGFVPAFISSIRYAPIHGQQKRWKVIGERLERQWRVRTFSSSRLSLSTTYTEEAKEEAEREGLERNKVLIVLGEKDPIIIAEEVGSDARAALGFKHVDVRVVKGVGHEVPIERAEEVADIIQWHWEGNDAQI
ncbi:alpha/beta-hydrolase [Delitschia confertaspora ATCC 74209]|uniref:Alpha/beta-hydrolase n=1 Tax=Delitschia confertaspora ATCC 74209 TaxID=1513339 RepID=A0A9P4MXB4_9PLEO|nr:alpha/beta-hydrolase [Delitschia confertaspora ATCC 74209]